MGAINSFLDGCRNWVRRVMRSIARFLNTISGGKLSPNTVTLVGLAAHVPIAWLIADGQWVLAAVLLVFFGLFDTLDGELARLQNRSGPAGMLLDASTDRMKEILLYMGAGYYLVNQAVSQNQNAGYFATLTIAAVGGSILVSYVKAKGETAVAGGDLSANEVNRLFQDGLLRFEIRMFVLAAGLVTGFLSFAIFIIALFSWLTAFERLAKITNKLK